MSTYRELVYLILDEAKGLSDDFTYTEDHLIFLLDKYRSFLLKQRYTDVKKSIPESNYQTLLLDLIPVPAISGEPCEGGNYLKSIEKIPYLLTISNPKVTAVDYFQGEFNFVSRDRMKYVGNNKFLKNMIYTTIAPDRYLYFKSNNVNFIYLEKVKITGVFENASTASKLDCNSSQNCELLDRIFPIEEGLIPPLIELTLKELLGATYRPKDSENNSTDDLNELGKTTKK